MIEPLTLRDCSYILAHLREADKAELVGHFGDINPVDLAAGCAASKWSYQLSYRGTPAVAFGAIPISSTTVSAWAFGTNAFRRCTPMLTRFIVGPLANDLKRNGFKWAEARSIEGHSAAHAWMQALGAEAVATLPGFGSDASTFTLFRSAL